MSNPNPSVLVDIDDTLADSQTLMLEFINARSPRRFTREELTRQHREAREPEYEQYVQAFLSDPSHIAESQPFEDALDGMQRLHRAGYSIHIASARRENLHDTTLRWLKQHGFTDFVDRIHPRSSKHRGHEFKRLVAEEIQPVAAFDDTYDVAETLAGLGVATYLIDNPWNVMDSLPDGIIRVPSFNDAVSRLLVSRAAAPPS